MKKLQITALVAAFLVTGAHAAVVETTVATSAQSGWASGALVTAMGSAIPVIAITAVAATLVVVASSNGGSSSTTGSVASDNN